MLDIIQDDDYLIAINKPAGLMPVAPPPPPNEAAKAPKPVTLEDEVKKYLAKRYKLPNAEAIYLSAITYPDTETSGVALFAKTTSAARFLKTGLEKRSFNFQFWALTASRPKLESGSLVHYLRYAYAQDAMQVFTNNQPGTQKATLRYELLAALGNSNLLVINTYTNIPHQVRAQLARIGCPARGDKKYGDTKTAAAKIVFVHLRTLSFIHPHNSQPVTLYAYVNDREQLWRTFAHFDE